MDFSQELKKLIESAGGAFGESKVESSPKSAGDKSASDSDGDSDGDNVDREEFERKLKGKINDIVKELAKEVGADVKIVDLTKGDGKLEELRKAALASIVLEEVKAAGPIRVLDCLASAVNKVPADALSGGDVSMLKQEIVDHILDCRSKCSESVKKFYSKE